MRNSKRSFEFVGLVSHRIEIVIEYLIGRLVGLYIPNSLSPESVSKLELPDSPLGAALENICKLRGLTETLAVCPFHPALTTKVLFDCGGIVPVTVVELRPLAKRIRVCANVSAPVTVKIIAMNIRYALIFLITFSSVHNKIKTLPLQDCAIKMSLAV